MYLHPNNPVKDDQQNRKTLAPFCIITNSCGVEVETEMCGISYWACGSDRKKKQNGELGGTGGRKIGEGMVKIYHTQNEIL